MKLTLRIIGTIAVVLLGIGVTLYILMQWGALVEYHAFEWRGIVTAKSPLVRATENLSYFFLSIGLPFGVTAIVLKIITSVREDKKNTGGTAQAGQGRAAQAAARKTAVTKTASRL